MYSFRYHLATICSIFLALAVGLLLGASITSSQLFTDTTSDTIQSLREEFDEIIATNQTLKSELAQTDDLTASLLSAWSANSLENSRILLIKDASPEQAAELSSVSSVLESAGAEVVVMTVNDTTFGLKNTDTLNALKAVLPEVSGEDYAVTLARALMEEWTTTSTTTSSSLTSSSALADTTATISTKTTTTQSHPLTSILVSAGIVSFTDSAQSDSTTTVVPKKITGCLDLCISTSTSTDGTVTATPVSMGLSLASAAKNAGYVSVLTQTSAYSSGLLDSAYQLGVSGVADMTTTIGEYSIVALFAGAETGVYGSSSSSSAYPSVPTLSTNTTATTSSTTSTTDSATSSSSTS
jgi:hypothetical protein